jgi:8-oxo-dGTP diphosphatase
MGTGDSPLIMVDGILEMDNRILYIKRRNEPFKGIWGFPGGKVDIGERVEDALKRELYEETGLTTIPTDILGVYSDPSRDPRGHAISVAFVVKATGGVSNDGDESQSIKWFPIYDNLDLAFDHNKILDNYRDWRRSDGTYWSSKQLRSTLL